MTAFRQAARSRREETCRCSGAEGSGLSWRCRCAMRRVIHASMMFGLIAALASLADGQTTAPKKPGPGATTADIRAAKPMPQGGADYAVMMSAQTQKSPP